MARINYGVAALIGLLAGEAYLVLASIRFDFGTYYRAAQAIASGTNPYVDISFRQLPLWAWLLQPIARLPFQWASPLWLVVSVAALTASVLLVFALLGWPLDRKRLAWLLGFLASPPTLICLFFGQATPFVLLAFCLALWLRRRAHVVAAGAALSLAMIKPHLALVLTPLLIAMPFRTWLGFAGGVVAWIGLSAVVAPGLLADFARRILFLGTSPQPEERPTLFGLGGAYLPQATLVNLSLAAALVAIIMGLLYLRLSGRRWPVSPDQAMVGSILLLPYVLVNDLVLLMPIFFLSLARGAGRWLLATVALASTLPFITMYLGARDILVSLDGLIVIALLLSTRATPGTEARKLAPMV